MVAVRALARAEREAFADLLDGLTPAQWEEPSLCTAWTVRDVAAHTVAYLDQSRMMLTCNMAAARWDVNRLNAAALKRSVLPPDELAARMRQGARPAGAGALFGGRVALIECLIHQQDVRRPLGLPRTADSEALRKALEFARTSPVIRGARRTRGLRLAATDLDWATGEGPEIYGTAEALLLAMSGRFAHVSDELVGDGVPLLAHAH